MTISMTRDDGAAFTLKSMRLSPVWTSVYYPTVTFTGTRADGSTVQQSFKLPNTLGFQTYTFVGFENVKSVTWKSTSASEDMVQFDDVTVLVAGTRDITGADFGSRDEVNAAPTAVDDAYTLAEDTTLTAARPGLLANDSDPDGDPLTAILVTGPTRGTLTLQADGGFSYRPNANSNGADSFTYRLSDGRLSSNSATVRLTVTAVNDAPVALPDSYGVAKSGVLTVAAPGVLANDTDVEGDALTASLLSGPAHGALMFNADGSFTYTPTAGYLGTDSFRYTAGDGKAFGANGATVTITVTGPNDPPTAADDAYTVAEDGRLNGTSVLANDADPNGQTLQARLVSGPAHGTLTLNVNGTFTYRPVARYSGPDGFTYRASDGALQSAIATVTLTVTPVNDRPVSADDQYTTSAGAVLTISAPGILANDSDPEGDALTAVLVTGPAHGALTLGVDGSFTYTPAAGYSGPDSFTYRARDGQLDSGIATVRLTPASRRYDFGTASSPLAAGYTRVTAATAYTPAAGFGWSAGTILDLDRGPGTDLTRDFNYTADGTFAVDLPDGTYTVALTLGDTGPYAHDQAGVYLQGVQVDTVSTDAGEVVTRAYVVAVTGGRLTLRLRDLGGGDPYDVIMALEITPGA